MRRRRVGNSWASSTIGGAPPLQGEGYRFKSVLVHHFAVVSQLVESEFSKLDVAGSIPVYRTNFGGNAEWWRVNPSPLERFSHPLKTAAGPTRCSWCSQGADESRGEILGTTFLTSSLGFNSRVKHTDAAMPSVNWDEGVFYQQPLLVNLFRGGGSSAG